MNGKDAIETFAYDPYDREILYQDAVGCVTHTSYDEKALNAFGQQVLCKTTADPREHIVKETFDPYGRLAKQETFNSAQEAIAAEEHTYDPCGNVLRHTDFVYEGTHLISQKVLAFTYDCCHRPLTSTRAFGTPDARTTQLTYYPGGNVSSKTLPDGLTLSYTYDLFNRVKTVRSSDKLSHFFEYNKRGDLLKATDELNGLTVTRQVDSHGNTLQEDINETAVVKTYDLFNRPLSLVLPDNTKILYTYDPLFLRKVERVSDNNYHHSYDSYDTSGLLTEEHLIADLGSIVHERDLAGRPVARTSPYFSQTCQYDSIGQLVHQSINSTDEIFAYDSLSQLIEEPTHTYSYDSTYNRTQKDQTSCQTNGLDELSMDSIACSYDQRGNLIEKKGSQDVYSFAYNPLDQLSEATVGSTRVCFNYDPLGRRIGRQQYTLLNQEWQEVSNDTLFYDGSQELGQIHRGSVQQLRVPGHKQNPIAIELQNKVYAPLLDAQGNIRRLVDVETSDIAAHYSYSVFGEQSPDDQTLLNPWQYAAKRLDLTLGLIDFGKRHYDSQLARWITPDPVGHTNHRNLYQYNFNNPFRYYDLNGTTAVPFFVILVEISFDFLVSWISAEAVVATTAGVALSYGVYNAAKDINDTLDEDPAVHQEAVIEGGEEEEKKGKRKGKDNEIKGGPPRDGRANYLPDPAAEGNTHTTLGTQQGRNGPYTQGATFKEDKFQGRIDVTNHGRGDHPRPHYHPATGPNSAKSPPQRIPMH